MKKLSRLVALVMAAAMVVILGACGGTSSDSQTTTEFKVTEAATTEANAETTAAETAETESKEPVYHSLRVGTNNTLSSMTPFATASSRGPADVILYEPLAILDGVGGELKGVIAKSWETIDDGTTWDVEIYDYVYDTNGNHITAEDVNYCCQGWIGKAAMAKCAACEVIDEYKVRITLTNNGLGTLNAVMKGFPIVSQKEYEASPDEMATSPVGTSPYVVTDYVAGGYITLEKADSYWQTDESLLGPYSQANVDEITFVTIQEAAQMTIALETGTIDAMDSINVSEADKFDEGGDYSADFTLQSSPNNQTYGIQFSGASSITQDLNFRLACAYAIDKDGLIKGAMDGRAARVYAFGSPLFPDYPEVNGDSYFEYDEAKAKEYLAKSDYNNENVRIICLNSSVYPKMGQIIQGYLQAIGITCEVLSYDNALFQTNQRDPSTYELILNASGASDYLVSAWYSSFSAKANGGETTVAGWADSDLESLMDKVMLEETHTQDNVDAVQKIIDEKMYALGCFYTYIYNVWSNESGIVDVPAGCKSDAIWWMAEFDD